MKNPIFSVRPASARALAFFCVALAPCAHAAVTNVAWYRLGENDPGAASGAAVTNLTTDSVGTRHLKQFGSPRYTNSVDASNALGSSLAVTFNGTNQFFSNAVVSTAVNNFGIEAWVKPNVTTNTFGSAIALNGDTFSGWGLFGNTANYVATFPAAGNFTIGPTTAGTWAHLALVRDNGNTKWYFNGVALGTNTTAPNTPAGGFEIGHFVGATINPPFNGTIDEVRVFAFAPGQFSMDDLLFNAQRVVTLPATGLNVTNATLNGRALPLVPTSAWFEYGLTTNYGSVTVDQPLGNIGTSTNYSQILTGLLPGVTYHFRAVASNNFGVLFGTDQNFTTPALFQSLTITNFITANGDRFGFAVAAVGTDKVLIGADHADLGAINGGAAYLFSTNGTLLTTFNNPTPAIGDQFGGAVAAVGTDKFLIGAEFDDTTALNAGAAYLFSTNGTLLMTFTNPTPAINEFFGIALTAVGTNRVLIGATAADFGAIDAGAAYLFSTSGTLLTTFTNPTPATDDRFGFPVAALGPDKVLMGAAGDDLGAMNAGAAYLFSTNGTLLTTFTNPTPALADSFGSALAAVGTDKVLIGADFDDAGSTHAGAAYLFSTNGALLTTFTNPTPADGDRFGIAVAAVGTDKVLIGATGDDTAATNAGAAYLFSTNGTLLMTYFQTAPAPSDDFGCAVAAVGTDRVLIGADQLALGPGAAYLFGLNFPPLIVTQPQSKTVNADSTVTFTVAVIGTEPLSYHWQFNGTNIPGATAYSYTRTNAQLADAGNYTVLVTNILGSVTSTVATLTMPLFSRVAGLPGASSGSVAWGDYDNDGRLDILLTGTTNATPGAVSQIWRNTGSGFININAGLPGVFGSSAAWGDCDNDGQLDIVLTGEQSSAVNAPRISQVLRNTGSAFTDRDPGLPGVFGSSVAWGDYDNDGLLDILLTGLGTNTSLISKILRNTGNDFDDINAGLPGVDSGSVAWGDYDNDGRLDILLTGFGTNSSSISKIFRNTGSGFTDINVGLPGVSVGSVAWGDYDNDGRLDIVLTGTTNGSGSGRVSQIWRNTGSGFTNINAGLPGVVGGSVAWGDYDNDGRLDILLTGTSITGGVSQIWRNTGNGFTDVKTGLPGVSSGSAAWGDFDNDGRLDIVLTDQGTNSSLVSGVWRNNNTPQNTVPNAPTGLTATISGTNLTLSWFPATDAQTPAAGLAYNVRVGTSSGGENVVGPMAAGSGYRRLPQSGNAGGRLFATIPIRLGQTNYCSVQAVDTAFAGSPFSAEIVVKVLKWEAPPIIVPLAVNSLPLGDSNGNGVIDENELNALLSNYFARSPLLYLTNVADLGGTNVTFALTNSLAGAFSVECSTNLMDWLYLGPATQQYLFTDTNAPAIPQRWYRLRWP